MFYVIFLEVKQLLYFKQHFLPQEPTAMADLLKCGIWNENFNNTTSLPKSLPCLHTFCIHCLEISFKTACPTSKKITFPSRRAIGSTHKSMCLLTNPAFFCLRKGSHCEVDRKCKHKPKQDISITTLRENCIKIIL